MRQKGRDQDPRLELRGTAVGQLTPAQPRPVMGTTRGLASLPRRFREGPCESWCPGEHAEAQSRRGHTSAFRDLILSITVQGEKLLAAALPKRSVPLVRFENGYQLTGKAETLEFLP